ncbi:hypothetical protein, partial [Clostridium cochlearium]
MEDYKKALINIGIIYVNLLFSIILMRKCLKIEGFSYIFFTKAFLIGAFIYLIYTVLSTKNFYNILMLLILFGIFCLWIYNNEKYIFMTIYKNIEYI